MDAGKIEDPKSGMQGNGWCFDVLVHSRRIAGRWLAAKAEVFDGDAGAQLQIAAERYAQIAETCEDGLECTWDLTPGPDRIEEWTTEMRGRQIARLESARVHDRAAIRAIDQALKALR